MVGGKFDIDLFEQVTFSDECFQLHIEGAAVDIHLDPFKHQRINMSCSACSVICEHQGVALSLILEEQSALGLTVPPPERVPV